MALVEQPLMFMDICPQCGRWGRLVQLCEELTMRPVRKTCEQCLREEKDR